MFHNIFFDSIWDTLPSLTTTGGLPSDVKRSACSMPAYPHSNVWVSKDMNTLTMEFALAGYREEDISITASNNVITVTAEPCALEECHTIHNGISRRRVNFSLSVDKSFDARKAKTSFVNGMLVLEMQKAEESQAVKLM